jgi:hypothetical protein
MRLRPSNSYSTHAHVLTFAFYPHVRDQAASGPLIPTFGAHRGLSPKTTPIMSPRRQSQHLHPDEGLPQTSAQNQPTLYPPTQTLSTIVEEFEHSTFGDNPKLQYKLPPPEYHEGTHSERLVVSSSNLERLQ